MTNIILLCVAFLIIVVAVTRNKAANQNKENNETDATNATSNAAQETYTPRDPAVLYEFSYRTGGGMNGGGSETIVERLDEKQAKISRSHREWHNSEQVTSEKLVDVKILDDIAAIVEKYDMKSWDGKRFTDMFVADGPSYTYSFVFGDQYYRFTSQSYPDEYAGKLRELMQVFDSYQ